MVLLASGPPPELIEAFGLIVGVASIVVSGIGCFIGHLTKRFWWGVAYSLTILFMLGIQVAIVALLNLIPDPSPSSNFGDSNEVGPGWIVIALLTLPCVGGTALARSSDASRNANPRTQDNGEMAKTGILDYQNELRFMESAEVYRRKTFAETWRASMVLGPIPIPFAFSIGVLTYYNQGSTATLVWILLLEVPIQYFLWAGWARKVRRFEPVVFTIDKANRIIRFHRVIYDSTGVEASVRVPGFELNIDWVTRIEARCGWSVNFFRTKQFFGFVDDHVRDRIEINILYCDLALEEAARGPHFKQDDAFAGINPSGVGFRSDERSITISAINSLSSMKEIGKEMAKVMNVPFVDKT